MLLSKYKCCFTPTEARWLIRDGKRERGALPSMSPSLIGHLASVDVKQHERKKERGGEKE